MNNYGKYFLQNALWLDDGFCQYYVQDPSWGVQEILDVQTMVFFWPEETLQWLSQCVEYDSFNTLYRLRDYLGEHAMRSYMLHRMDDRQVLHAAAEELTDNMSRVVVHPTIGWAVQDASHADFPVLPPGVEAEPELDGLLLELQACLDDLVAEQQQQYKQYEARLARMSPEERELFYSRNTGDAVYDTIIDDTWQTLKAAPAVLEKAARAFPGFYKNTLKTLWKIALTPSRMGILIGQGIATGNYNPLQQEIDSIVTPMAATYEQALEYKSMLTVLFQDEEIYAMLYDFAERYWDATHPVERTRMTASAVSDVLVTLIIAIFTAGVGVAVNVAAKAGKLGKAAKLLKKITETIKRTAGRHRVPENNFEGGVGTTARTGSGARKGGIPEVESPKKKPDETVVNEYNASGEGVGPEETSWLESEAKPDPKPKWTPQEVNGRRVYQRDDLFDPNAVDANGMTNLERMRKGRSPIGHDGEAVNLHHLTQNEPGSLAEVGGTFHSENSKVLHGLTEAKRSFRYSPDGKTTEAEKTFRRYGYKYWQERGKGF